MCYEELKLYGIGGIVRAVVKEHPEAFDEILCVLFDGCTKLVYDGSLQE